MPACVQKGGMSSELTCSVETAAMLHPIFSRVDALPTPDTLSQSLCLTATVTYLFPLPFPLAVIPYQVADYACDVRNYGPCG